jgi:hypothetical protein
MRVALLEDNGAIISDRLVDATSEFYAGPKLQHKGPVRIEITLTNNLDVNNFKNYLDQLVGNLPIKENIGRGRPTAGSTTKTLETPREDILTDVEGMVKEGKDQMEVIEYLRKLGFVFILTEDFKYYFNDFDFNKKDVGEKTENGQYPDSFSWMVRCIKRGKDPRTDKFDPMIIFGFNLTNQTRKVVPYLYKERKKPLKVETSKRVLSLSTVEFTKLPKYMLEDERLKFSVELRQLMLTEDRKPSKFFERWSKDALVPDKVYEALSKRGIKFKNDSIKHEQ